MKLHHLICSIGLFLTPIGHALDLPPGYGVIQANTFAHNYPRLILQATGYPWRTVGKLLSGMVDAGCTATLIGERLIVTNRHCVGETSSEGSAIRKGEFYFLTSLNGDQYYAQSTPAWPIAWGSKSGDGEDWAVLELEAPIGKQLGYLGLDSGGVRLNGFAGELPSVAAPGQADLCSETASPWSGLRAELSHQTGGNWMMDVSSPNSARLCMAGYPGDLGGNTMALSYNCGIVGSSSTYIHDCPSSRGSSGTSLFYKEGGKFYVVALNRAGGRPGEASLLAVPFGYKNANLALSVEPIIRTLDRMSAVQPEKAGFYFVDNRTTISSYYAYTKKVWLDFKHQALTHNPCGLMVMQGMQNDGLIDAQMYWRADILSLIQQKATIAHPSKPNVKIPAKLVISATVMRDNLAAIQLYSYDQFRESYPNKGIKKTVKVPEYCHVSEKEIFEFLNSL